MDISKSASSVANPFTNEPNLPSIIYIFEKQDNEENL
jgi:hypothetical protein